MTTVKRGIAVAANRSIAFHYMQEQVAHDMAVFYELFQTNEQPQRAKHVTASPKKASTHSAKGRAVSAKVA